MTQYVKNWLNQVHPELSDKDIEEINSVFDNRYYGMCKNGSSDASASDCAWTWIISVYAL